MNTAQVVAFDDKIEREARVLHHGLQLLETVVVPALDDKGDAAQVFDPQNLFLCQRVLLGDGNAYLLLEEKAFAVKAVFLIFVGDAKIKAPFRIGIVDYRIGHFGVFLPESRHAADQRHAVNGGEKAQITAEVLRIGGKGLGPVIQMIQRLPNLIVKELSVIGERNMVFSRVNSAVPSSASKREMVRDMAG